MFKLKTFLATSYWCVLSGCISVPESPQTSVQPQLYKGRFSVTYPLQNAVQREQGGFEWRIFQDPHATPQNALETPMQLLLTSPLGTTVAAVQFDPTALVAQRASLRTPQSNHFASNLPALMEHTLGWELPLQNLLPWLTARAVKPENIAEWAVEIVSRHDTGAPKIITLTHIERRMTARLVFDAPE
jgi:outer membrane biogenesis lipoprotein LolB